jgi:hypothetical protein
MKLEESKKVFLTLQVHIGVSKKTGQFFSESARQRSASFWRVYPPKSCGAGRRRGAGSCNDFQFHDILNRAKIDVNDIPPSIAFELEDDILCEMELE